MPAMLPATLLAKSEIGFDPVPSPPKTVDAMLVSAPDTGPADDKALGDASKKRLRAVATMFIGLPL
jgi:hypothetical protein